MANYLRNFKEIAQYESYISGSPIFPNVSKINEDNSVRYNPIIVTSITINSFYYTPETIEYTGGTSVPTVTYTLYYSNGTSATTGGSISYIKNSGIATMDDNGKLTWTANTGFNELTTNVTVIVTKDGINGLQSTNNKQSGIPVVATSVTVDSFSYNPSSVHAIGGTATPIVSYTIEYNDGHSESTGGSFSYVKNSGVATVDTTTGIVTWTANTSRDELTTNITVTVTKDSVNNTLSTDIKQVSGHLVGDICYYDVNSNVLAYTPYTSWTSSLGTPLAVCVIPTAHNVYKNGNAGFVSIYGVTSAGTSSNSDTDMVWSTFPRGTGVLTDYPMVPTWNNTTSSYASCFPYGYISSDSFSSGTQNVVDTLSYYNETSYLIPSPYAANGSLNPAYTATTSLGNNALSDFNGSNNTKTLTGISTSDITYVAAIACNSYSGIAISAGNWYLPAMGELAYLMPRFNVINAALTAVGGVAIGNDKIYWSSSESESTARNLHTNNGGVDYYSQNGSYYIRPFISLP